MGFSVRAKAIKPSSTLAISAKAAEMRAEGMDVVSFGVGEPDFDTPAHIAEAAIAAIQEGFTRYTPAAGILELRQAVCDKLKRDQGLSYDPSQVVISNGAKHSLTNIFMAGLNDGDEVIIPVPYWLSYSEMVRIAGGVPVLVKTKKENRFMMTREELLGAITPKTKMLVVTSPSNPTGMVSTRADLQMIADVAVERDILVISDEIYEKLIYDPDCTHVSIASLGKEIYDRTVVIGGVAKSYAMTGWRIGFAAGPSSLMKLVASLQSHMTSNPNSIAQKAALAAFAGPQECVEEMRKAFLERRDAIYDRVQAIPLLTALKPQGAFYLFIDVSGTYGKQLGQTKIGSAADFAALLLETQKVAAVPCADFGMPDYLRLSYAASLETIHKGMDRIEAMVQAL